MKTEDQIKEKIREYANTNAELLAIFPEDYSASLGNNQLRILELLWVLEELTGSGYFRIVGAGEV